MSQRDDVPAQRTHIRQVATPARGPAHATSSPTDPPTFGELTERLTTDLKHLASTEYELLRAEVAVKAERVKKIALAASVALVCAALGAMALVATLILALAQWLPAWSAAAIPTLVLLVAAGALALRARSVAQRLTVPPRRTIHSVRRDVQEIKEAL